MEALQRRTQEGPNAVSGLLTGLIELDERTGGLHDSELTVIAGRPGYGKSALALTPVRHVAIEKGLAVFWVSPGETRPALGDRLLSCEGRVDLHRLRRGHLTEDDRGLVEAARGRLRAAKLFIDDAPRQDVVRVAQNARQLKETQGLRLVVVDPIQLIDPGRRYDSRHEELGLVPPPGSQPRE